MNRLTKVLLLAVVLAHGASGYSTLIAQQAIPEPEADDQATPDYTVDKEKWGEAYLTVAKQFQLTSEGHPKIQLVPRSLLHWNNPVRVGRTEGDFYVWTDGNQPVMVGTVFSYDAPASQHAIRSVAFELHTLSDSAIQVKRQGSTLWTAPADALEAIELSELPAPKEKPFQRLREMREIARDLVATTTLRNTEQPLRLLPNPIYRYELADQAETESGLIDGAVFAMVTGTDPELLVFIEARRKQAGESVWQITPARFTNLPITLRFDGKVLWDNSPSAKRASYRPYIDKHRVYLLPTQLGPAAMERLQ